MVATATTTMEATTVAMVATAETLASVASAATLATEDPEPTTIADGEQALEVMKINFLKLVTG